MPTFKDTEAREWTVPFTISDAKQIKSALSIDPLDMGFVDRISRDPITLCDVLYCLCKPQCDARNLTDEDFGRALAGDALEQATAAFCEAYVGFFPSAKRNVLGKALAKSKQIEDRVIAHALEKLDDPALDVAVEKALSSAVGGT